jgi:hypothetical protein
MVKVCKRTYKISAKIINYFFSFIFSLMQAIVHTMLDDKVEAKNWWEKFITIVEGGFDIPID